MHTHLGMHREALTGPRDPGETSQQVHTRTKMSPARLCATPWKLVQWHTHPWLGTNVLGPACCTCFFLFVLLKVRCSHQETHSGQESWNRSESVLGLTRLDTDSRQPDAHSRTKLWQYPAQESVIYVENPIYTDVCYTGAQAFENISEWRVHVDFDKPFLLLGSLTS